MGPTRRGQDTCSGSGPGGYSSSHPEDRALLRSNPSAGRCLYGRGQFAGHFFSACTSRRWFGRSGRWIHHLKIRRPWSKQWGPPHFEAAKACLVGLSGGSDPIWERGRRTQDELRKTVPFERLSGVARRVAEGSIEEHLSRLQPAVIHLSAANLHHDDIVEIIVTATLPGLRESGEESAPPTEDGTGSEQSVQRFRFRAVEDGFSWTAGPQFVIVKRIKDVSVASESDAPANFVPAPGGYGGVRYRTRSRWSEWLIPSVQIAATTPKFDPSNSIGCISQLALWACMNSKDLR